MKRLLALAVILALGAGGAHAKSCTDPATHKFVKCGAAAPATTAAPTKAVMSPAPATPTKTAPSVASMASGGRKTPNCVKGKLCGNSCIKATDVCHKPT